MQPKHLIICIVSLLAACQKNSSNPGPAPIASFTTNGDTVTNNGVITLATYDQFMVSSTSANAESVLWDFGNDSTSVQPQSVFWYPKSGTYTLMLTVKNKAGVKSTVSRQVKVTDRIMKQFQITGITPLFWPVGHSLQGASVWGVIRLAPNGVHYLIPTVANASYDAPVVYQTPVITAVDSTQLPYKFDIPATLVVDFPAMAIRSENGLGYTGAGYGLEVYARDATGTYLLSSSYAASYVAQSGSISWPVADYRRDLFIMQYGNASILCDYE